MKNAIWNIFIIFTCLIRTKVLGLKCYASQSGDNACADRFTNEKIADPLGDHLVSSKYHYLECLQKIDPSSGECAKGKYDKCLRASLKFHGGEVIYLGCDSNSDSTCNELKNRKWPIVLDSSKCESCSEDECNKKDGISKSDEDKKKDDDKPSSGSDKIECYHIKSEEFVDCKTFEDLKTLVDGPGKKTGCEECSHAIVTYENDEKPINIPFCDHEGAIKCHSFKDNPKNFEHLGFNGTKTVKSSVCESCKKDLCMREERSKGTRYEFSNAFMLISTAAVILYFYKPF